jgi:SAM-dependent methyltransferase
LLAENSYGWRKRLDFVAETVDSVGASRVLDVGCGTGAGLTVPLAAACPRAEITAVDSDVRSIRWAQQAPHPANLRFSETEPPPGRQFDVVVASEVLEHVEDPAGFVLHLRGFVRRGGRLVITVPNGYGPFEAFALFEALLNMSGAQRILRAIKRRGASMPVPEDEASATLAISPHVNFFSRRALLRLFEASGLRLSRFRPTSFLCGYLVDSLIRPPRIVAWNARVADRLPPCFASDWMFELEPQELPPATPAVPWRRNAWGRMRRRLNLRRWGLD